MFFIGQMVVIICKFRKYLTDGDVSVSLLTRNRVIYPYHLKMSSKALKLNSNLKKPS